MSTPAGGPPARPNLLDAVFGNSVTVEYASLTASGRPVTVPLNPFVGDGTLDVSTGLTYPTKAERARRNPKVCLLFADPIGRGMRDAPVVVVQGHAAVRDADLQANTDRYVQLTAAKYREATSLIPAFLRARLGFYYARIWIQVTPLHIRWWPDRSLATPPQSWHASPDTPLPLSDPAPPGSPPRAWKQAPPDWRSVLTEALRQLPLADLTVVDADGYPLCLPVSTGALRGNQLALSVGPGAPSLSPGPACLTLHGHGEVFTAQENRSLLGEFMPGEQPSFHVERAIGDWSIPSNKLRAALSMWQISRALRPRVEAEAARRGQPVPRIRPARGRPAG